MSCGIEEKMRDKGGASVAKENLFTDAGSKVSDRDGL